MALLVLPKGRLVRSGQNQMCHLCGWLKLFLKNAGRQKKIKNAEGLVCRVGKKSAVKFICCPDVSIIVCSFNGCCVGLYACL